MGRLIDADALIETMKRVEADYEDAMTCPSWWTAYSVISEQPTAYDVEKVVAELEEELEEANIMWDNGEFYRGVANGVSYAIDTVKRGGVK